MLIFERNRSGFKFLMCAMLLVLASAMASFGWLCDSLGVVIGVMIVGPSYAKAVERLNSPAGQAQLVSVRWNERLALIGLQACQDAPHIIAILPVCIRKILHVLNIPR